MLLTQLTLQELLSYDCDTGIFTRTISTNNKWGIGRVAGSINKKGYIKINLNGKKYFAHRLAWLYVYGVWPENQIDHKDTIKHHNWISNLRNVTNSENMQNQIKAKCHNKTGFLGVSLHPHGKYTAQIVIGGRKKHIGQFLTPELAHAAYIEAKRVHHSTCTI